MVASWPMHVGTAAAVLAGNAAASPATVTTTVKTAVRDRVLIGDR